MEWRRAGTKGSGLSATGQEAQKEAEALRLSADQDLFAQRLYQATPALWVVRALLALNVLVFLAMLADGAGLMTPNSAVHLRWGANFGPITKEGDWWRLVACTFLHFGLVHLAMNMWVLWGAGGLVERLYGNFTFLSIYLFAGLTGSFASLYWNADKVVSAGASGAIFGVYGALAAYVLRQPGSVPQRVLRSLAVSTLAFIGYSVVLGAVVSAIDNAAHAGGLAGGFLAGLALARPLQPRSAHSAGRAVLVAACAAGSLALLFTLLPPPAYSHAAQTAAIGAIRAFALEEELLAKRAATLVQARKDGRLTDPQMGEGIERELLPGWSAAHARFSTIHLGAQAPAARQLHALTEYIGLRRDMFAAYAAGMKTGDQAPIRRADALAAESQRLMKEMRERSQR